MPSVETCWLFPALLAILALRQRRYRAAGMLVLVAEFFLLALIAGFAETWMGMGLLAGYAVIFTLDYRFFDRLGWALDVNVLRFALREPENTRALLAREFGARGWAVWLATTGAAAISAPASSPLPGSVLFALILACMGMLAVALHASARLPPALNFLRALHAVLWQRARPLELASPKRLDLRQTGPEARAQPNLLLIVCESLSKRVIESEAGRNAAPRYHAFLAAESSRLVAFPYALANSASSDIAYASLFAGLSPDASHERFHRNPLIWGAAKARGYRTSLYTSQSLRWRNLDRFLLDDTLDRAVYREALDAPAVNDLAMDDRVINRIAMAELAAEPAPFCAVVNYNMLHAPFTLHDEDAEPEDGTSSTRYLAALRLFDRCFGDLLDALNASGKLDDTILLFTADHGEAPENHDRPDQRRMPERLDDLTPDILNIPFWVRLPEGEAATEQRRHLRDNAGLAVANVDVYPTILDVLGYAPALIGELASGQSLCRPVSPWRSLVTLNTGDFRWWACEPFALARSGWLLIFHDISRRFELLRPEDAAPTDHWPNLSPSARAAWLAELAGRAIIGDILSRRGLIAPPRSSTQVAREYNALPSLGRDTELHRLNNWGLFSLADWEAMSLRTAEFIGITPGDRVFEAGCGSGAFLDVLYRHYGARIAGVDLAANLVDIAKSRLVGDFRVGDIQDMAYLEGNAYDKVVSQGVFLYLPSLAVVERAAKEMIRLAKPGGSIYVGVLNDPERLATYASAHTPSGHAFIRRDFWYDLGARHGLEVECIDQERIFSKPEGYDGHSRLRYSVRMRKPCA